MKFLKYCPIVLLILFMSCPIQTTTEDPIPSTIEFADGTSIVRQLDCGTYYNPIIGIGNGKVTYTSSSPLVAKVDPYTGIVTLLEAGRTVITASKEATNKYTAISATYNLNVTGISSTIEFADGDRVTKQLGSGSYTNTVTGIGDGTITYTSSNGSIATVDSSTGEITLLSTGATVITVEKASSETYAATTNSYTLTVTHLTPSSIIFTDGNNVARQLGTGNYTNSVSGDGNGRLTYTSETTSVATINSGSGEITLLSTGTTLITVEKASSGTYAATTNSFNLTVTALTPSTIVFADGNTVSKQIDSSTYTNIVSGDGNGSISYTSSTPSVASVNTTTGEVTPLSAGTTSITANKAGTGVFEGITNSYTLTITKIPSTINFSDGSSITKQLGSGNYTNIVSGDGDGTLTYTSSQPNIATVDTSGEVTLISAGVATIRATRSGTNNYSSVSKEYTLTVTQYTQSEINFHYGKSVSRELGSGNFENYITGVGTGNVTYSSGTPSVATIDSNGSVSLLSAGTTLITVNKAQNGIYSEVTNTYTLTVTLKLSTIVFSDGGNVTKRINRGTYKNSVTGSGPGQITYTSGTPSVATVDSNTGLVTFITPGTTTITANKSPSDNYTGATDSYDLVIEDLIQSTIVFADGTSVQRQLGSGLYENSTSGVGPGQVTFTSSNPSVATIESNTGEVTLVSEGATNITANKSSSGDYAGTTATYSLTVKPLSDPNIRFGYHKALRDYDDQNFTGRVTTNSNGIVTYSCVTPSIATVDSNSGIVTFHSVGSCTITATQEADGVYKSGSASYIMEIEKSDSTINFRDYSNVTKQIGSVPYTNIITGVGNGTLSYTSSKPEVATVNSTTGEVTLLAKGTTYIRATKTETATHNSVQKGYNLTVDLIPSTINFGDGTSVRKKYADVNKYTNPVSGNGNGAITYFSFEPSVASVDRNSGEVTIHGYGVAKIEATKAATATHEEAIKTFTLEVTLRDGRTVIGDDYKGGILVYVLKAGDSGYSATQEHGIIMHKELNTIKLPFAASSFSEVDVPGSYGTAIGDGKTNTQTIIAKYGDDFRYAAGFCGRHFGTDGQKGWFLPSRDELIVLFSNQKLVIKRNPRYGGFYANSDYWSSSSSSSVTAWTKNHSFERESTGKEQISYVVPIKYF